jgi:hypothetical protein
MRKAFSENKNYLGHFQSMKTRECLFLENIGEKIQITRGEKGRAAFF